MLLNNQTNHNYTAHPRCDAQKLLKVILFAFMENGICSLRKIEKLCHNANRYTWVWKKSCIRNRQKVFDKISALIDSMNLKVLGYLGVKFEKCEDHEMEKYMKFTMYKKETTDKKYHTDPYRAVNFARDEAGNLICPNGCKFHFKRKQHVRYNKYGRTEEIYECESCEGCSHKQKCCPRARKNRTIRLN